MVKRELKSRLILFIIMLGFGLRLYQITLNNIWIDEAYSYFLSLQTIPQIIQGTMTDQHPPLYYILLHYWLGLGHELFTLRLLSATIGTLSVALIYHIGKQMFNVSTGMIASFLLAISPIHIWYSQETRMYALLVLLTMLSTYLCWRLLYNPLPSSYLWIGLVIINLMAVYTHNIAIFIILFQNLFWLICLLSRRCVPIKNWLIAQTLIGIGYLFWLPIIYLQVTQHPMPWIAPPTFDAARHIFYTIAFGEGWNTDVRHYIGIMFALLMVVVALFTMLKTKNYLTIGYICSWVIIPVIVMTLLSFEVSLYQKKQFLIVLTPFLLIVAVSINQFNSFKLTWLILFIGLIWTPLYNQYTIATKTNWSHIANFIDAQVETGDVIYLSAASIGLPLNYYLTTNMPQTGYPQPFTFERGGWDGQLADPIQIDAELRQLSKTYSRVWLLEYGSGFWDPQGVIPAWMDSHAHQVINKNISKVNITLYQTTLTTNNGGTN